MLTALVSHRLFDLPSYINVATVQLRISSVGQREYRNHSKLASHYAVESLVRSIT